MEPANTTNPPIQQPVVPAIPPEQSQSPKQGTNILMILIISLLTLVVGLLGGFYLGSQKNNSELTPTSSPTTPPITSQSIPNTTPAVDSTNITCIYKELGISLTVPKEWICKTDTPITANGITEGILTVSGNIFTIEITNQDKGAYCLSDEGCVSSVFLSNAKMNLTLYTYDGIDKGISGLFKNTSYWITIKYKNMDKQKLTTIQKKELEDILNTFTVTK